MAITDEAQVPENATNEQPCRAAPYDDLETQPLTLVLVVLLVAAGYWGAYSFVKSVPAADELSSVQAEYDIWAVLVGLVIGFAVGGAAVALIWLRGIRELFAEVDRQTVARWVASVLMLVSTLILSLFISNSDSDIQTIHETLGEQTRPIPLVAAVGSLPGLIGFLMLRSIAAHDQHWKESGQCRVRLLMRLRNELQRLLTMFAAFLTLIVVATGMRRRVLLSFDDQLKIPVEEVILYGLVFAALLGALYGVAKTAIDRRGALLVDDFAPLPDPEDPALSKCLGRRDELERLIGQGTGARRSFESTVAITAPLVTALIGTALS